MDRYKKSIDEIAALGFDTVSLVIDTRMENGSTTLVWLDMRKTPTPEKLADLIQHAKSKKLRVILMPIVLLDKPIDNEWRGTIKPANWEDWFDSYREMLIHFAWIAEQNKVDVLSVGSELVSAEKERGEWKKTITAVREVFNGQLTYSANWDHYKSIPFWNDLDLIGMNSYWSLDEDPPGSRNHMKEKVTVEKVEENWQYVQEDLLAFQKKMNKPILFLEVGWCSMANAAHEPWDYTRTDDYAVDKELQRKLYEGFFNAWYN
jgi:Glycoside Hydrolase Family 113